jgi:hypothetical protein
MLSVFFSGKSPGPMQTVPPVSRTCSTAFSRVISPLECDFAVTHTVQSQHSPPTLGGHRVRQSLALSGGVTMASFA